MFRTVDIFATTFFVQRGKRHERQGALKSKRNEYQDRTIQGKTRTHRCFLHGGANFTSIVIVNNDASDGNTFCQPFCQSRCECCLCHCQTGPSPSRWLLPWW